MKAYEYRCDIFSSYGYEMVSFNNIHCLGLYHNRSKISGRAVWEFNAYQDDIPMEYWL